MKNLIPYRKKNKWGFSNSDKEIVIKCDYDDIIFPFSKSNFNLALVAKDNKTCWINSKGIEITPFADMTHQFSDKGISVIILNKEIDNVSSFPNCLFIDSDGQTLFENEFLTSNSYQNGYCIVMDQERKYGVIDALGKIIHSFNETDYIKIWEKIGRPYFDDRPESEEVLTSELQKFSNENRYIGFKNKRNEIVIQPKFYMAQEFTEGFSSVAINEREFFFINEQGEKTISKTYYFCQNFNNGIAKVVTDKIDENPHIHSRWGVDYYIPESAQWGYIDVNGNEFWEN
jgi:hypothetical protein